MLKICDEEGNDLTSEDGWLRDIMNFDLLGDSADGMVVADSDHGIRDIWGTQVHQSTIESEYSPATMKHKYTKPALFLVSFSQLFLFARLVLCHC